jgi:hypothetical protein
MSTGSGRVSAAEPIRLGTGAALVRHIAVVGLAGLVTGLAVGGVGSRLFMRISAMAAGAAAQGATTEAGETVGAITSEGTMALMIFVGIASGIVGAVFYATFRPWLAWTGRFRGLAFGVVLFAVASATSDVLNPDNFDFSLLGNRALNVALIVLLFLAFGLVMEGVFGMLDRRLPSTAGGRGKARVMYGAITGLGVALAALAMPQLLFSSGPCDCDPPIIASWFVVIAAAGTLVLWASEIRAGSVRSLAVARALGWSGLVGACLFGLWRAGSDAVAILTASQ